MPCISFIVPVYNMERLLPRALRSLRAQTLTDFEAILINDGSKDGSAALCAQAVAEDARFRFIDQPNGGVATARNAGLDAARGEYIFFLDPDDWVEPDAAEVLYHAARNADADCVEFGLYLDSYDENDRLLHTQTSGSTLSGVYRGAPFKEHFDETASSYLVTNKLFRRAFLEQHRLRFSCHQLGEDGLFFVAFYRQNPGCLVVLESRCTTTPLPGGAVCPTATTRSVWRITFISAMQCGTPLPRGAYRTAPCTAQRRATARSAT